MDALIFIDTNIFLDFYRIKNSEVSMSYLKLIEEHRNRIITGSQVEMEYKKNRQTVFQDSQLKFKNPDWNTLSVPALIAEGQEAKRLSELRNEVGKQQSEINEMIEKIFKHPRLHDPVYKSLESLFSSKSKYNLATENAKHSVIYELALKRFNMGYPPRKKTDTSIGDAINWEWIVQCAIESRKNIIIVTRDGDYGSIVKGESFINDWLYEEFNKRVPKGIELILENRLAKAFKSIDAAVSDTMVDEESKMIKEFRDIDTRESSDRVSDKIINILKSYD